MHEHHHEITLGLAFFLGAVHALEPGHGKTAMLVYLSGQSRSMLHPLLMGISSAVSHSISLIAIAALVHATHRYAIHHFGEGETASVDFILHAISAFAIIGIGIWMLVAAIRKKPSTCSCSHHKHNNAEECGTEDTGKQRSGYAMSLTLGAAFGLLPCPSAVAAYMAGMSHGGPAEAYVTIGLFALGIASSLTVVGLVVQRVGQNL